MNVHCRPRLESLDGRVVPAALFWRCNVHDGSINADNPAYWADASGTVGHVPSNGDSLTFDGGGIANCNGLTPGGSFHSVTLASGYNATVILGGSLTTDVLTINSGKVSQQYSSGDIYINTALTLGKGELNSNPYRSAVHLKGATATINPGAGNRARIGSDLLLEANVSTGAGAQATVVAGTVEFTNSAGAVIGSAGVTNNNNAKLTINPAVSVLAPFPGAYNVVSGGEFAVTGSGAFNSELPLYVQGGKATISGGVTANFNKVQAGQPANTATVYMSSGQVNVQAGSTLKSINGVRLTGGTFSTLPGSGTNQTATVVAPTFNVAGSGVDIVINNTFAAPGGPHTLGTLAVTGDVAWSSGTYRPVVDAAAPGAQKADVWTATGTFAVQGGAQLAPGTINGVPPQNALFDVISATNGITGTPPAVNSPVVTYVVTQTQKLGNPNVIQKWSLRKL